MHTHDREELENKVDYFIHFKTYIQIKQTQNEELKSCVPLNTNKCKK